MFNCGASSEVVVKTAGSELCYERWRAFGGGSLCFHHRLVGSLYGDGKLDRMITKWCLLITFLAGPAVRGIKVRMGRVRYM